MNQSFNESPAGGPATRTPPDHAGTPMGNAETAGDACSAAAEFDSCIGGRYEGYDASQRGLLSGLQFPEVVDTFHELEQFVRRNPWPMLALGFMAGYLFSRSKVR